MSPDFDVIVVGLGAMGSAALYHLARRGVRVLGLDQFDPPHAFGSSHGETRVIREAYFEDPVYVPLVQRAYDLWLELEKNFGQQLYLKTGGLMIGLRKSAVVSGALRSARDHRLPYELLDQEAITTRFPGLRPTEEMVGILEPRAGILFPEKCVAAHLALSLKSGAVIHPNEQVREWKATGHGVEVTTEDRSYTANRLILSAGPWITQLASDLRLPLKVERQVLLWFEARDPRFFTADRFPIHLWEHEPGRYFYGFPDLGSGVKIAFHHTGEVTTPATVNREVNEQDIASMREILARHLPQANGSFLRGTVCLYTNTLDGHFILDRHPRDPRVILASPCSGHGFKFASAIGEILADLASDLPPRLKTDLFSLRRFAPS